MSLSFNRPTYALLKHLTDRGEFLQPPGLKAASSGSNKMAASFKVVVISRVFTLLR